jgi:capsular exopolysaccharide synthesis family protein
LVGYVRGDALGLSGVRRNGDSFVSEDDLEAFRILRTNVNFLTREQHITSIVVTSALPEEGKSTVAAWFAYASAVAGKRTLLVECDFRRPVLAARFGVDTSPGLSDYLVEEAEAKEVVRPVSVHGREAVDILPLVPAGRSAFQPTEMIASKKFKEWIREVSQPYDLVVLDSAPLLPVSDTLELVPQADAVLFCVRLGQTTREQAQAAKQALLHMPEKPTGLVITGVRPGSEDDYYGYYSYTRSSKPAAQPTKAES